MVINANSISIQDRLYHHYEKCKGLGLSNFNEYQVSRVLKNCSEPPLVNQIESNPYANNQPLIDHCLANGVEVMAYSPLGNPAAPPTRKWEKDAVPLIKGKYMIFCGISMGLIMFRSGAWLDCRQVQQKPCPSVDSICH